MHLQPHETDGLPQPRRLIAIIVILLTIGVTVLDGAMVNIALPGIARDLGIAPASATWLLNAYQLTVVSTLLPFAALGEILGFRRVYLTGAGVFAGAALGAALAPDFGVLLGCRILQGLGASAVMSLTAGLIRWTYPSAQLGRAIGINAMVVATCGAAAPSLAGAILAVATWPALFLVDVPVAGLALLLGLRSLPTPPRAVRPFDAEGAALNVAAFLLVFLGLDLLLPHPGLGMALLAAGAVAGWRLVRTQLDRPAPLLPLDLLGIRVIGLAVAASVLGFAAWYASYVALPFRFQAAGWSQVATGLLMTPWPLAMAVAAPLCGRLSDRVPTALLCAGGMAVLAAGLGLLASLPAGTPAPVLAAVVALCGAGFGAFQTPNNRTMLGAAPKARSGGAGGLQATARLLGSTVGTTTIALCFQLMEEAGPRVALLAGLTCAVGAGALSLSRRRVQA